MAWTYAREMGCGKSREVAQADLRLCQALNYVAVAGADCHGRPTQARVAGRAICEPLNVTWRVSNATLLQSGIVVQDIMKWSRRCAVCHLYGIVKPRLLYHAKAVFPRRGRGRYRLHTVDPPQLVGDYVSVVATYSGPAEPYTVGYCYHVVTGKQAFGKLTGIRPVAAVPETAARFAGCLIASGAAGVCAVVTARGETAYHTWAEFGLGRSKLAVIGSSWCFVDLSYAASNIMLVMCPSDFGTWGWLSFTKSNTLVHIALNHHCSSVTTVLTWTHRDTRHCVELCGILCKLQGLPTGLILVQTSHDAVVIDFPRSSQTLRIGERPNWVSATGSLYWVRRERESAVEAVEAVDCLPDKGGNTCGLVRAVLLGFIAEEARLTELRWPEKIP